MAKAEVKNIINGSSANVWWDGELILEVVSVEAKVITEREDVPSFDNTTSMDSRIVSTKGEGTLKVKKVYSRGINKFVAAWVRGEDPRSQLITKMKDESAIGKQTETTVIDNVWFNEVTIAEFEKAKNLEREFPFGFVPSSVSFPDTIENI